MNHWFKHAILIMILNYFGLLNRRKSWNYIRWIFIKEKNNYFIKLEFLLKKIQQQSNILRWIWSHTMNINKNLLKIIEKNCYWWSKKLKKKRYSQQWEICFFIKNSPRGEPRFFIISPALRPGVPGRA
jgi:hypothetical protein